MNGAASMAPQMAWSSSARSRTLRVDSAPPASMTSRGVAAGASVE